jgi:UDP-glucose 4-epimerase
MTLDAPTAGSARRATVLVTGGAGYIGSHTCVELTAAGYAVVVVDDFSNSRRSVMPRMESIGGQPLALMEGDIRDQAFLRQVFTTQRIDAVIHFAGLTVVADSLRDPLRYYDANVNVAMTLLQAMREHGVRRFIFSSSATVYDPAAPLPFAELSPLAPATPYGETKLVVERLLADLVRSMSDWKAVILRYFNPAGAHPSGLIGEWPNGPQHHLMPYLTQVAAGLSSGLKVFGSDYPTPDGTGIRDYVHVTDLALGHVAALRALEGLEALNIFNLGTGRGYSVLELIAAVERTTGRKLPYSIAPRRAGDVATSYADPRRARDILGWQADRDLETMCRDAWRWQQWAVSHAETDCRRSA